MPSLVVHLAAGCLLAVLLLDDDFTPRAAAVVLAATALPDLDSVVGLALPNAHRAALHTALLPVLLGFLLAYDLRIRDRSVLRARFGPTAGRVAAVALLALAAAGIGLDLVTNGVNLLYPLYDRFYTLDGHLLLSNTRGVVQTFVQPPPADAAVSTTANTHYSTAVDPTYPGVEPDEPVERVAPVVASGWQLWLVVLGYAAFARALLAARASRSA
ncbi:metal-dependent hydrolase [Halocalculus aciditolerans]|uniref:LexA-binding, inner membrane-associated hydrolase n=1 Tax=Halocalculus aciditolerans TaxID=1383812 RepID=A0A830FDN9_9EURY|nr:metal-dependent hydrolase [Halocalculus aciditolerans]GGL64923.1 hypothetical protein GCM10009039_23600 [Halocalculus aciditolerans]